MATWDVSWYDMFCGETWESLDATMRLCFALIDLGFNTVDATDLSLGREMKCTQTHLS